VEQVEKSAATLEEALEAALEELGISEQEAEVEIAQEPRGGFLGLGSQEAVVRVRLRRGGGEASPEELEEQADMAADFLEELCARMGIDADVEPRLTDETMYVEIWGAEGDDEMGILIGRHGAVLESLQELVRVLVGQRTGTRCRVIVDVEDYQKRRRARLVGMAREISKRVQKSGRQEKLEPMNSYERKLVHDVVGRCKGLESESEGEEPERRVVIRRKVPS